MNELKQIRDALYPFANIAEKIIGTNPKDSRWLETPMFYMGDDKDPMRWTITGRGFMNAFSALSTLDRMMSARGDTQAAVDWDALYKIRDKAEGKILDKLNDWLYCNDPRKTGDTQATAQPAESVDVEPRLTGDIKVGVTTFRKGVKLSTVQRCIDSHINNPPRISGDTNLLEDLAKNMRSGSVEYYSEPNQPDVAELLERAKALVKYCEWQINEGTDHHPTLPSAIVAAKEAISRATPQPIDVGQFCGIKIYEDENLDDGEIQVYVKNKKVFAAHYNITKKGEQK